MKWNWEKTLTINLKPKTTAELKENIKNGTTIFLQMLKGLKFLQKN